jgi:hypothetical protein
MKVHKLHKLITKAKAKPAHKHTSKHSNIEEHLTTEDKYSSFSEEFSTLEHTNSIATITPNDLAPLSKGVHFQTSNRVKGSIGHSTLMFPHQVTEGSYYLEFKVLPFFPLPGECEYTHNPEVRVGVCGKSHRLDAPLGFEKSIGLHLSRKVVLSDGTMEQLSDVDPLLLV